ncbi:GDSL esterase/lipase At5g45670-like [Bidens hawaiensis]|uniref:GDSL esterase/lipase At5g45670-like n=1 Tax=Bidens hawaiensis TaxID=980011 RepID=UPI00404A971F
MTSELRISNRVLVFIGLIHVITHVVAGQQPVPCYFIFGDSLVDSGNNNALNTAAKANYWPYGADFPQGVTGRFTNGRTIADIIGALLGFSKFIPPYATATDQEISAGVNYGSGSAGIREESGSHLGDRVSMDVQLLNHEKIINRLTGFDNNKTFTNEYLKKCIYLANIGSNDYINNYFMPTIYPTNTTYTTDQYATTLAQQYSQQLKTLYNMGARKIVVFGLGQIGCTPTEIARYGTNGRPCVQWIDDAVKLFNDNLKSLVDELNSNFFDARFTFINLTSISSPQGDIPEPNATCCQIRDDGQCVQDSNPCLLRALTIFYDGFHPSEITNSVIASRSYIAVASTDTYPYDINRLASMNIE